MRRIFKTAVLGLAVAATTLSAIPAQADHRWHRHHHRHHDRGGELAAGLAGLAFGAIVGGILSQPSGRVYIDPPAPRYRYYGPAPAYSGPVTYYRAEPWSPEWYRACSIRYRSFDPRSGTYLGYDGHRHFCEIR
ncbi:BA14K family protein [Chelativorans sp. SCAU2101]|uniref:Lectin-like protein BA14k n=1 Tax=Chelativorans petroleitrophicus TaxID=2975484 RepID=A0A9X2XAP2_9HYPH|nr:BA14K family protein [Chelativorans petroleitrophicus]MCT8991181.1 BA14K family protein [Chelativorans petroleitrophicus]